MRYLRWALMVATGAASVACDLAETVGETVRYGIVATVLALAVIAVAHLEFDA